MNHIVKMQAENKFLKQAIEETIQRAIEIQAYYSSPKFQSFENDFAHVSTDVQPKITELKIMLQTALTCI